MEPELRYLPVTPLAGIRKKKTLLHDKTRELWQEFMPRVKTVPNRTGNELYSAQIYPVDYFESFQPKVEFEKWAAAPVVHIGSIPENMELLLIPEGWYAVFHYKGPAGDPKIFNYIFGVWLPSSEYQLDERPHFEILGDKYKNDHPDSEEEIWIPVLKRAVSQTGAPDPSNS
jgi:AraC family transcriptional regulator